MGVAYGDSDVLGLTSGLRELCRQFMDYAQSNAITALGKMVGKELWVVRIVGVSACFAGVADAFQLPEGTSGRRDHFSTSC